MLDKIISDFKKIALIPRCSGKTDKIREYLFSWGRKNGFDVKQDKIGNVIIYIPSTKGREKQQTIIFQNHMDIVCVKTPESNRDLNLSGVEVIEKDGYLKALDSSLGADNGIGMVIAMNLAKTEEHPALELLFTVDEETGMDGAMELDGSLLKGKKLINIDTEDLGKVTIGCAGGVDFLLNKKYELKNSNLDYHKLNISGLRGGHSAGEIKISKGNAILAMGEFLEFLEIDYNLEEIVSGEARNAIPRVLIAYLGIENIDNLDKKIKDFKAEYFIKYGETIDIKLEKTEKTNFKGIGLKKSKELIVDLIKAGTGIIKMSEILENTVQTSKNLGVLNLKNGELKIIYLIRSSFEKEKLEEANNMKNIYSNYNVLIEGIYPGWQEKKDSKLINDIIKSYKKFHKDVSFKATHGGLECGLLKSRLDKGLEAVSIGPDIFNPHSYDENCEISSVLIIYNVLKDYLENIKN